MQATVRFHVTTSLLVAALCAACAPASPRPQGARPVRIAKVTAAPTAGDLRYSASIEPRAEVALAFKVAGYVAEIRRDGGNARLLQQGDLVRRGDVLARLDQGDFAERVEQAQAQRAESAAYLDRVRADAGRSERLYATASLTRPDYDAATAALAMADARLAGADAQLAAAELVLRDATLQAPMDAVVLSRDVELGTLAAAGTVAFRLADVSRVKAVFGVPDRVAGELSVGDAMTLEAEGGILAGRVSAIAPSAEAASRVFQVEVTVDNPRRTLKPGMIVTAVVRDAAAGEARGELPSVPLASIVKSSDGAYAVFVVDGGGSHPRAVRRSVQLGEIAGARIAVPGGLVEGESVVVSGAALLVDGEAVRVIP